MEHNEESKQISKYNEGYFSISRLQDNWLRCASFIRKGNLKAWKTELDVIWLELYPDVVRKKDEALFKKNGELKRGIAFSKNRNELFSHLIARHEWLRKVQDSSGKGGVYQDADPNAIE